MRCEAFKTSVLVCWTVTPRELVGDINISGKRTVSVFRNVSVAQCDLSSRMDAKGCKEKLPV
jgi:hypothetical protein